jgi:putative nucleotidyltransferase with HDIG domain
MTTQKSTCIILVEDDAALCRAMAVFLEKQGYRIVCAHNGKEALEFLKNERPDLVISDIRMPVMDGIQMVREMRAQGFGMPVIMTTGFPDFESALQALHGGAYDYVIKPYQPEILLEKIRRVLAAFGLESENLMLSRLASLHDTARSLARIHDMEELLDFTLDSCLRILDSESGSIYLQKKGGDRPVLVRQKYVTDSNSISDLSGSEDAEAVRWVSENGRSVTFGKGVKPPDSFPFQSNRESSVPVLFVPVKVADSIIGAIKINRASGTGPFGDIDLNIMEVFASQAGIAISNAELYSSLNRKIEELSLFGKYAEDLMKHLDRFDVINCLFDTVSRNFPLDFIGFLLPEKRSYEFLYWSRNMIKADDARQECSETVDSYVGIAGVSIHMKKVKLRQFGVREGQNPVQSQLSYSFSCRLPLMWEKHFFGMAVFRAVVTPADATGIVSILQSLVNQTRIALANTQLYDDVKENYIKTIKALAIAVDAKDTYTHGHSENVMKIAEAIASEIKLGERWVGIIRDAGLLHDIGKIGIPGTILNKPGPLTNDEFNGVMKTHALLGANIVKDVPFLRDLYYLILSHHEHYDGSGYPDGLNGEKIPLGARILHVADAFEAMTSNRPYRASLGASEAVKRLEEEKGRQFDPVVVEAFLKVARKKGWIS